MIVNSTHLTTNKYTLLVQDEKREPVDKVVISSPSDLSFIYSPSKLETLKDSPIFLAEQYKDSPLATAGKVMGGTVGTIASLPVSPKEEFKKFLDLAIGNPNAYSQDGLKLLDRQGDAFLIRKLDEVPRKLLKSLVKSNYREKDIKKEEEIRDEFTIGKKKPIKTEALGNKVIEIIQEHPDIKPHIGSVHTWSPEAKKYNLYGFFDRLKDFVTGQQKEFPTPIMMSKLFLLLACGWTNRFAVTGKEGELEKKIMSYKDNSVQIHDMFRESYLLNKGDIYLTVLTCENVLAKNPYKENRQDDPLQKKLSYIRNDSKPLGDKYGGWYHFFGAALYGLLRPEAMSKAVVLTEALGSYFLEGPDKQETNINVAGSDFGHKLQEIMKKEIWKDSVADKDKNYMDLTEFN